MNIMWFRSLDLFMLLPYILITSELAAAAAPNADYPPPGPNLANVGTSPLLE